MSRIPNKRMHCPYCCQNGWADHPDTAGSVVPCPACERGAKVEEAAFPNGFWTDANRQLGDRLPKCECHQFVHDDAASREIARQKWRWLRDRLGERRPRHAPSTMLGDLAPAVNGTCDDCRAEGVERVRFNHVTVCDACIRVRASAVETIRSLSVTGIDTSEIALAQGAQAAFVPGARDTTLEP